MTESRKEEVLSFKITYDPHSTETICDITDSDESIELTRYLYNKTEVEMSFVKSVFDQNREVALFWGYELYYSGFITELFEVITNTYETYYKDNHPLFEFYINRIIKKWDNSGDAQESHKLVGNLIVNLVYCKMSLYSEIKKRNPDKNIYLSPATSQSQKFITLNPDNFEVYKTPDQSLINKPWKSMEILCKYTPTRNIANILNKNIHINQYPLKYGWEFYAYNTPIWKERMNKYSGFINNDTKTVDFIDEDAKEEFYDKYGYDLDEQPRRIQNMTMCLDKTIPPQLSWEEFCDMYKTSLPVYTIKIKKKKKCVNI
jgi:hypothetical protein